MHNSAGQLNDQVGHEVLAEVIPLQGLDVPSFYQRNTGALPKIGQRSSEINRRSSLPTPINGDGVIERIRNFFASR